MNIISYLQDKGYAKADKHAHYYIIKLELNELYNSGAGDVAIKDRIELYEAWKKYMPGKDERDHCAMMAISGIPVPKTAVDMFALQNNEPVAEDNNPFGDIEPEDHFDTGNCKHGIPVLFCSECSNGNVVEYAPTDDEILRALADGG